MTTFGAHLAKYQVSSHIVDLINTSERVWGKREVWQSLLVSQQVQEQQIIFRTKQNHNNARTQQGLPVKNTQTYERIVFWKKNLLMLPKIAAAKNTYQRQQN